MARTFFIGCVGFLIFQTAFANESCPEARGAVAVKQQSIGPAGHDTFGDIALVITVDLNNEKRDLIMDTVRNAGGSINLVHPTSYILPMLW